MRLCFITKCDQSLLKYGSFFITKWDSFITKYDNYYKINRFYSKKQRLLQNALVHLAMQIYPS